jgi:predicted Rossmann fold flavoprotein
VCDRGGEAGPQGAGHRPCAAPAEKIRISGGGRCNFTNLHCSPANFLSQNPRFCVSALKRYTQNDFLKLVDSHRIAWHEKTLGQLFCDNSAKDIIAMLLAELAAAGGTLQLETEIRAVDKPDDRFSVATSKGPLRAKSLVVATGGPSIPKMGATGFGYELAKRFGLEVVAPRAALVPLTFSDANRELCGRLAGVSVDAEVSFGKPAFAKVCCSPTVAFPARRSCRSPPTGRRASRSR